MKRIFCLLFLFLIAAPLLGNDLAQSTATRVSVYFEDPATGLGKTGLTVTSVTCRYVKSDMTTASFSPTASGGSNDMTEAGHGYYPLEMTAAQLDTLGPFDLHCQISGFPSPATVYQIHSASSPIITGTWATAADVRAEIDANSTQLGSIKGKTDFLPSVTAGDAGGVFIAGVNAATSITTGLTANVIGNVTGNLSGSVGSVTGAVGSVTGAVGSVTGAVGSVTGSVGSIATGGIVAGSFAANSLAAAAFAADASTEFATTLMATTFEGAHTFKHFLQYGASALFGKYNSSAGTFNFRDIGDTKNRIVYTTTATSRATVTLSPD